MDPSSDALRFVSAWIGSVAGFQRDDPHKSISPARDRLDAVQVVLVVDSFAKLRDMNGQVGLFHKGVRPDPLHQGFFLNKLPVLLNQHQ